MYIETFHVKLKSARESAGYTQTQVAMLLNLKQCTIASYESGRTQPDIETMGKLADFYDISLDWLVGTKGRNK